MPLDERILELLLKRKEGVITIAEQSELAKLLNQSSNTTITEEAINEFFDIPPGFENSIHDDAIEKSVQKLNARINTHHKPHAFLKYRNHWQKVGLIAASVLVVLALSFFFLRTTNSISESPSVVTKKGSKSNLVLPDGTKVWMNSDTKLTYDKHFGEDTRDVVLSGEAFFDVVKDKNHPFIVHTKNLDVKVLGTAFNVRAYESEITTQTTLIRGSVEVLLKREKSEKIVLKPNEKLIVKNYDAKEKLLNDNTDIPQISLMTIKPDATDSLSIKEIEWVKNKLAFDQTSFREVVLELERWYGVSIEVKDSAILDRKVSGRYENESLPEILETFKLAIVFKYSIENNHVIIYK